MPRRSLSSRISSRAMHSIDAALEALRHEAEASRRRRDVERRINDAIARAEFEPSHRAAIAGLQEVLALDPDNATLRTAIKRRRSALRSSRLRAGVSAALRSRLTVAAVALAMVGTLAVKVIPPALSRFRQPAAVEPRSSRPRTCRFRPGSRSRRRPRRSPHQRRRIRHLRRRRW